ncbi:hypothetical protein GcM1_208027 [Golovinomyces cichoracearum]|uniref:Uncharacterized protein n=1 Tax=Golovinomyces cichoracearum TaxID=62708 RepID=A0A420IW45_9PEZI|nr:hypothetical protein GcM1_208027 [Golovinomyces cichoracearum]
MTSNPSNWANYVTRAIFEVNNREVTHQLHSPVQIAFGFEPTGMTDRNYPEQQRAVLTVASKEQINILPGEDEHVKGVIDFILQRNEIRREILRRSDRIKDKRAQKHDMGLQAIQEYNLGPFIVVGFGGDMVKSYCLRQIEGTPIPSHYNGDALKPFRLREGYFISKEEIIPVLQNIRLGTAAFKLSKSQRTVPGAWNRDE